MRRSLRILLTITAYPPSIGGAQIHAHETAKRLQEFHQVQVLAFWSENRTDWLLGTTLRAPSRTETYCVDGIKVTGLCFTAYEKLSLVPDVLFYYLFKRKCIGRIAKLLAGQIEALGADLDLIHNHRIGREPLSYASYGMARRRGIPFFFTPYHHPRWKGWWYRDYQDLYRLSDGVFVLTQSEKKALAELGVAPERIFVIGGGAVLSPIARPEFFREQYGLRERPLVLFMGQKYKYKGLVPLLKAAEITSRKYPEVAFAFMGPRTRFSRRLFSEVKSRNVLEIGNVDLEEKTNALAACDIFCLPSAQESLGMVFLEAWMMERPVIGGDAPAVKELISDGNDGYIVKRDPEEIAERIVYLLDNPSEGVKMGRAGKEKTLLNYSWEKVVEKIEAAYRKVTGIRS